MMCGMKEIHLTEASPRDDIAARVMDQRHKNCDQHNPCIQKWRRKMRDIYRVQINFLGIKILYKIENILYAMSIQGLEINPANSKTQNVNDLVQNKCKREEN